MRTTLLSLLVNLALVFVNVAPQAAAAPSPLVKGGGGTPWGRIGDFSEDTSAKLEVRQSGTPWGRIEEPNEDIKLEGRQSGTPWGRIGEPNEETKLEGRQSGTPWGRIGEPKEDRDLNERREGAAPAIVYPWGRNPSQA
ncbi:hypothetical protein NMY22_g13172 [Coprinellus aureogranulatus]|nr:hypothetical protein NMY22_g13172 [Coprinellus aureogranulatus]